MKRLLLLALLLPAPAGSDSVQGVPSLGRLLSADFNTTVDQAITMLPDRYAIRRIVVQNCSVSLTTAVGGFYTGASKTGTTVVAATQTYAALTAAGKYLDLTLAGIVTTDVLTASPIYFSLTTAHGAAATCDISIFGDPLP